MMNAVARVIAPVHISLSLLCGAKEIRAFFATFRCATSIEKGATCFVRL
jgi:hypothetical protein